MSWKARWDDGSFTHLLCNFGNSDFQIAVACATLIDLLHLDQDYVHRLVQIHCGRVSYISGCSSLRGTLGWHFKVQELTQVKNQT